MDRFIISKFVISKTFQQRFFKFLSICLAIITLITTASPNVAYATGVQGDNSGGGNSSMNASSSSMAWSRTKSGYRFYLINADLERVTPIYDFVFVDPRGSEQNVGAVLRGTRFDTSDSPNEFNLFPMSYLAELTGSSVNVIPYPISDGAGRGEEFRAWFLKNIGYSNGTIISNRNPASSSSDTSSSTVVSRPLYNDANDEDAEGSLSNSTSTSNSTSNSTSSGLTNYIVYVNLGRSVLNDQKNPIGSIDKFDYEVSNAINLAVQKKTAIQNTYNLYLNLFDNQNSGLPLSEKGLAEDRIAYALGACKHLYDLGTYENWIIANATGHDNLSGLTNSSNSSSSNTDKESIKEAFRKENALTMPGNNPLNIGLEQNLPLASTDTSDANTSVEGCPAMILLGREDTLQVEGYDTPFIAMVEGGHFLVIEPLCWINIGSAAGTMTDEWGNKFESYRTYGSYYNLANKWYSLGGDDNGGHFYTSYMHTLGNNCLIVNSDIKTINNKTFSGSSVARRNVSESVAEMDTSGLSMHLYSSADFGNITVIKNYIDANGNVCEDNVATSGTTPLTISDEGNYRIVQWETSTVKAPEEIDARDTWEVITQTSNDKQTGTVPTTVNLSDDEKVVYIQLQLTSTVTNVSGDWVLEESEISKAVTTGNHTSNITVPYNYGKLNTCNGHGFCSHSCNNDCDSKTDPNDVTKQIPYCGHWCNNDCDTDYCDFSLVDKGWTFKLKNQKEGNYNSIQALTGVFTSSNSSRSIERDSLEAGTENVSGFTYDFVIYRGNDNLSLAAYAEDDGTVQSLGFNRLSSKQVMTRSRNSYEVELPILLVDNSTDLKTTSKGDCWHGSHEYSDDANTGGSISYTGDVAVKVYSGVSRNPDNSLNTGRILPMGLSGYNRAAGRMIRSGSTIKFNPYVRMTYQTLNSDKVDVNVLSEFEREIIPNDYAEIAWQQTDENLKITSNQWSTHAGALKLSQEILGVVTPNIMLPGGAVYTLKTDQQGQQGQQGQQVSLNTYQTILAGEAASISTVNGTVGLNEAEAKEYHEQFVEQAVETFDKTELVQYVSIKNTDDNAWDNGVVVYEGADISGLNNGSRTASTDDKYYLREDINNTQNTSRNDLDVKVNGTEYIYHRVYSDTSGNVYYVRDNSLDGVVNGVGNVIFRRGENYTGASCLSGDAQKVNQRTGFIQKFMAAIERNTGNDFTASWASEDGKWYNEAYAGIIVIEQKTAVEIKFDIPTQRSTVLDPKLIPQMSKKSEELKAFMMQYKTDLSEDTVVTSFKGVDIFMKEADMLFNSNKVFIVNMTVQDLS